MLSVPTLTTIRQAIPRLTVGVLGDLFLDRYLDLDAALTEASLETGLDAYQVVRVRPSPGAAGTVINNLVALGVGTVLPVAVIGDDGEGYELRQALTRLPRVGLQAVFSWPDRRTPTYTKPLLHQAGQSPRELHRLDIKNRTPLPRAAQDQVLTTLFDLWPRLDALVVLDQVSEAECGVITAGVRDALAGLGRALPDKLILADSRERIGQFRDLCLKPNRKECVRAVGGDGTSADSLQPAAAELAKRTGRPLFCTCGADGILVVDPRPPSAQTMLVPALPVSGPIDPVGAGDSVSAGLACAIAAGVSLPEAAAFANLLAAITIRQIGATGTTSWPEIEECWKASSRFG